MYQVLERVRKEEPLIHHITNWVTIYDCANIVKVFAGSPVMAHAPEEAADMASIADALVINIGTLNNITVEAMKSAMAAANKKGIPVILDAVGVGATKYRNEKIKELLEYKIAVLKGNASEIASTAGISVTTKGVDSGNVSGDMVSIARELARDKECVVVVTGKEDICTDGESVYIVKNGTPMLSQIVGAGCMAGSVIATFCAVEKDYLFAAIAGLVCFEIAAENADKTSEGPGTFKNKLFDKISTLSDISINKMKKLEKIR
ncbi:MAG: hydroxyethylthiazole kinase [Endomicrobia bacterium]|nr:hydroxyethylthiazole kinase [Endomicrobiia bacterium]MCL2506123.1 hydroxyethylthiazole kinase [Endomicrobiia bacterium]